MHRHLANLFLVFTLCVVTGRVEAADVTFQLIGQQATDAAADLAYTGTLDRAYAFGTLGGVPLNGIVFAPFAGNAHGDTTTLDTTFTYSDGGLSGNYGALVSHGQAHDLAPASIHFNGLTPGAIYSLSVIGMGLRARSDCCEAGAGYTNMFVSGDTLSGTGWIHWEGNDASSRNIRGTFIADASGGQTINFNLFSTIRADPDTVSANVNAVLLSYTAVPEPATAALVALSGIMLMMVRRHRIK
jgi:hypothetical protein